MQVHWHGYIKRWKLTSCRAWWDLRAFWFSFLLLFWGPEGRGWVHVQIGTRCRVERIWPCLWQMPWLRLCNWGMLRWRAVCSLAWVSSSIEHSVRRGSTGARALVLGSVVRRSPVGWQRAHNHTSPCRYTALQHAHSYARRLPGRPTTFDIPLCFLSLCACVYRWAQPETRLCVNARSPPACLPDHSNQPGLLLLSAGPYAQQS